MKTIFSTLLFFFVAQFTFAQIVATAHVTSDSQSMKTKPAISARQQAKMANSQNQMVTAQLSSFIQKELRYSDIMAENGMEGEALIQINISETGAITQTKVVKSPNAEMSALLLKTLEKLHDFDFGGETYYGHKKIRIPVDFSMR